VLEKWNSFMGNPVLNNTDNACMDRHIPKRLPSTYADRMVNLLQYSGDMMIQLELEFDRQLDVERLAKAIVLALKTEPVLGCRFVLRWWRPYWERLDESEWEAFLLARDEGEYEVFKASSIDTYRGPQVKACLWRSPAGDRLLLKVAHEVADAGGVKEIVAIVSSIYSRLADEPDYQPEPNFKGSRSVWQIIRHVPLYAYPRIYRNCLHANWEILTPRITHRLPIQAGPRTPLAFVCRHLNANRVGRLAEYGRERDATLNDLIMAAFFRALVAVGDWDRRMRFGLDMTVDLRRYVPGRRVKGICNLGAIESLCLGTNLGDDFDSTLMRVTAITQRQKANWTGLDYYVGLGPLVSPVPHGLSMRCYRKMVQMVLEKGYVPNSLTNMGPISTESVTFQAPPVNAYLLPPPIYPPSFLAGLSGYAETLTLSAGVYPSQKDVTERFFDAVLSELPE